MWLSPSELALMVSITNEGFLKIIMCLPPEYVTPRQPKDVISVFSLYDLYLLWFLNGNKRRFFNDARLEGTGNLGDEHEGLWERLGFDGGYSSDVFNSVNIGFSKLTITHDVLRNYSEQVKKEPDNIINALLRIIYVIPKATHFPAWFERVQSIFSKNSKTVVGNFFAK